MLRVRVLIGRRVRVDHPHEALGGRGVVVHVDHRRVGGLLEGQIGGDLGHPLEGVAVVEDLGRLVGLRGEEQVGGAELDGVEELVPHVAHRGAAVAGEGRGDLAADRGVIRVVELLGLGSLGRSDDRVVGRVGAEVDALLVVAHLADRGNGLLPVGGQAVAGELVAVGRDRPVPVGVHGVLVHPGLLLGGQARQVELAHGDHCVAALAAHVVAVDLHPRVEAVVQAGLLQLLDGLGDDLRVEQAHLAGEGVVVELPRRGGRRRVVVGLVVHVVQAVRLQSRVDVALDVGGLQGPLVGAHPELLDEGGVGHPQDQGGHDGHRDARPGQAPRPAVGGDHEEDGDQHGDHRQDRVRGQRRVDVGVHRAVDVHAGVRTGE